MKMKRDVIFHFWILISLALIVRCDEDVENEDEFSDDKIFNSEEYVPPTAEYATDPKIISRDVMCLVCKATIFEMEKAIKKVDPLKKVEVSGFRMDPPGNSVTRSVQYSKSETYLTELMDTICKQMDDYVKARDKTTRKLMVMKIMTDSGGMNPLMSSVDFVQDGDLNKSLEHFCLEVLEDHEESILKQFMEEITPTDLKKIRILIVFQFFFSILKGIIISKEISKIQNINYFKEFSSSNGTTYLGIMKSRNINLEKSNRL